MDRNNTNNSRFTYIRRQGQQQQNQSSSLNSSSLSNNNQHLDNHRNTSSSQYSREPLTQHDELIRYIREAWTNVREQGTPIMHCNESDHQLKNFKPFNLEEYWDQRLVQNIHVSHGHQ